MAKSAKKMTGSKAPLTRCSERWTEARYNSFIKSAIRSMTSRWPVKYDALRAAQVGVKVNPKTGRNAMHYKCACCGEGFPVKEVQVDHKQPLIPTDGSSQNDWNVIINRALVEVEGFQVLCKPCHRKKTNEENQERKDAKREKTLSSNE